MKLTMIILFIYIYATFLIVRAALTCNLTKRIDGLIWDLSYCGLKVLTKDFRRYSKNFTHLNISHNYIEIIDRKWIAHFQNVRVLDLSFNRLTRIDMSVFEDLSKLTELYIYSNRLTKVKTIHLESLLILDLSYNKIEKLPWNMFSGSCKLKKINFSHNSIKTISRKNFRFKRSIELNMYNNKLNCHCENYYLNSLFKWSKHTSPFCLKQKKQLFRLSKSELCDKIKTSNKKMKKKEDKVPRYIYSEKVHIHFMPEQDARKYDVKVGIKIALTLLLSMVAMFACLGIGKLKKGRKLQNNEGQEKENTL
ncbi:unnamed protein product [Dimorphilus gyrociliatus]|uniref:Uncharacterized protein n=1 Tax=Dimorphilus gyrociliatus TaxID=2664684 RepID=A0A7I8W010_9ANNE|nr:unnamed protein product [Dimorphilus gyrociliatus]